MSGREWTPTCMRCGAAKFRVLPHVPTELVYTFFNNGDQTVERLGYSVNDKDKVSCWECGYGRTWSDFDYRRPSCGA